MGTSGTISVPASVYAAYGTALADLGEAFFTKDCDYKKLSNMNFRLTGADYSFVFPPEAFFVSLLGVCVPILTTNANANTDTVYVGDYFYTFFDATFDMAATDGPAISFQVGPNAPAGTDLGGMFGLSFSAIAVAAAAALAF